MVLPEEKGASWMCQSELQLPAKLLLSQTILLWGNDRSLLICVTHMQGCELLLKPDAWADFRAHERASLLQLHGPDQSGKITFLAFRLRRAEWWPLWRSPTCAAGQSSARGWAWPRPPCRSPPAGCPASGPPSKRSRKAPRRPRCLQSWRGSRAGPGCSAAELSPTSRSLWWWSGIKNRSGDVYHLQEMCGWFRLDEVLQAQKDRWHRSNEKRRHFLVNTNCVRSRGRKTANDALKEPKSFICLEKITLQLLGWLRRSGL